MWEPKPHVIAFAASLVFVSATSSLADVERPAQEPGVIVDDIAAGEDTGDVLADGTSGPSSVDPSQDDAGADTTVTPDASGSSDGAQVSTGGSADNGGGATDDPSDDPTEDPDPSPSPTSSPSPSPQPTTPSHPSAGLYTGADATRGISADELVMCGHAALALGAAFDTSREDLNVYWEMVNDAGGLDGRQVEMTWEDDAYLSDQAITAATTCADKDPFMILGGIGFDQIPGVRNWAESNRELYLHHIAVAPTKEYAYSYSLSPTVESVGEQFGQYIVREHADKKVGVMYRTTANWQPGSDAGTAVMEQAGLSVKQYPVNQNQGVYAQQLNQMQNLDGIEVVFLWENALTAAQVINQASEIGYFPTWVVFPFQTTIDILTDPGEHTIEGVAAWNSYAAGGYGGAHADFAVDQEIAEFEAAYAEYRPDTTPNDLLWQVWVGNKILHQMFIDCGRDCDRNTFAGMMQAGYRTHVKPGCPIDFGHEDSEGGHHGGHRYFSQEMFRTSRGGYAFRTNDYCVTSLR